MLTDNGASRMCEGSTPLPPPPISILPNVQRRLLQSEAADSVLKPEYTASDCQAACYTDPVCGGYSFGVGARSPPPPANLGPDRRLLQIDELGDCYLFPRVRPAVATQSAQYVTSAACYARVAGPCPLAHMSLSWRCARDTVWQRQILEASPSDGRNAVL